jgi:hypothetical protein
MGRCQSPHSAATLTVVLLVAFALVGLSARSGLPVDGPDGGDASRAHPGVSTAIAVLCVLAVGLVVRYVLYLIIARTPAARARRPALDRALAELSRGVGQA